MDPNCKLQPYLAFMAFLRPLLAFFWPLLGQFIIDDLLYQKAIGLKENQTSREILVFEQNLSRATRLLTNFAKIKNSLAV